ncbi:unnamed protein product [Ectocarpus sp. 8 AP-2014]
MPMGIRNRMKECGSRLVVSGLCLVVVDGSTVCPHRPPWHQTRPTVVLSTGCIGYSCSYHSTHRRRRAIDDDDDDDSQSWRGLSTPWRVRHRAVVHCYHRFVLHR